MPGHGRRLGLAIGGCLFALGLPPGLAPIAAASAFVLPLDGTPATIAATPDFATRVNGQPASGDVALAVVMPGGAVTIAASRLASNADLILDTPAGSKSARRADRSTQPRWRWTAPSQPGRYRLTLRNRTTTGALHINVLVETPFDSHDTRIGGYRIGAYQQQPRHDNPIYKPPAGLIRVTPDTAGTPVAPGLELDDFVCHQKPHQWPKYLRLAPHLLTKLNAISHAVRATGIPMHALTIMSGYRTPWYNADIGNDTVYSRHLYGGAADIFVDTNDDGTMDDLNGDGRVDVADARWLARLIEQVDAAHAELAGGLSAYPGNSFHGPFVHVDVRGTPVRW